MSSVCAQLQFLAVCGAVEFPGRSSRDKQFCSRGRIDVMTDADAADP